MLVGGDLIRDKVFQLLVDFRHKNRPRGDAIRVEHLLLRYLYALRLGLRFQQLHVLRGSEASAPLVVDLRARRYAVDRDEEQFLRLDLIEQHLDVSKYILKYSLFRGAKRHIVVVGVRTDVQDTVGVQI